MPALTVTADVVEPGDESLARFLKLHGELQPACHDCLLAVTAKDSVTGEVLGFLELDEAPQILAPDGAPRAPTAAEVSWAEQSTATLDCCTRPTTAWVKLWVLAETAAATSGAAAQVAAALIRAAFAAAPPLQTVLLLASSTAAGPPAAFARLFAPIGSPVAGGEGGAVGQTMQLFACSRSAALPPPAVRRARVQDADELAPLLQRASTRYPALAQLPESCRPDEPFALARIVTAQGPENEVLVARERGDSSKRPVGFLVATCDVDLPLLLESFDLGPFDGLMDPELFERLMGRVQLQAASSSGAARNEAGGEDGTGGGLATGGEPLAIDAAAAAERKALAELVAAGFAADAAGAGAAAAAAAAMGVSGSGQQRPRPSAQRHRVFTVTVLCMDDEYEAQAGDLLAAAFEAFADKDWAVLTLPHAARLPPLARSLVVLQPAGRPASSWGEGADGSGSGGSVQQPFPGVLLLAHRAAVAGVPDFDVRVASADDIPAIHALVASLPRASQVVESAALALGQGGTFVASAAGEVMGVATLAPASDAAVQAARSDFELDAALPLASFPVNQIRFLEACEVDPLMEPHSAAFLTAVAWLTGACVLLHQPVPRDQAAAAQPPSPCVAAAMERISARHHRHRLQQECDNEGHVKGQAAPLFAFTKALTPRRAVHSRVVIIGASDTGLACAEALLTAPRQRGTAFTNIALISPGGLPSAGPGRCRLLHPWRPPRARGRMGLEGAVAAVDGEVVAIDTAQRVVGLRDGRTVGYDVLAVATGLQDPLPDRIAAACPATRGFVVTAPQLLAALSEQGADEAGLRSRVRGVLLVGAGLDAFGALSALLDAGVAADAITWVASSAEDTAPGPVQLLRALARRAPGAPELPTPQHGVLKDVAPTEDGSRATCLIEAPDGSQMQLEVDLIVAAATPGGALAPTITTALKAAGLVVDGRVVVGPGFQVAGGDGSLLAAGPAAKFSRRCCAQEVCLAHYSSWEVGARLADAVAAAAETQLDGADAANSAAIKHIGGNPNTLPRLVAPCIASCRLPGRWAFALSARGTAMAAPSLVAPPGGVSLLSFASKEAGSSDGDANGGAGADSVLSMVVDSKGEITQVALLAPESGGSPLQSIAQGVLGLVGLPITYIAQGLGLAPELLPAGSLAVGEARSGSGGARAPVDAGVDIAAKLAEPWAELVLSDCLGRLRALLVPALLHGGGRNKMGAAEVGDVPGGGVAGADKVVAEQVCAAAVAEIEAAPPGELEGLRARLAEERAAAAAVVLSAGEEPPVAA